MAIQLALQQTNEAIIQDIYILLFILLYLSYHGPHRRDGQGLA